MSQHWSRRALLRGGLLSTVLGAGTAPARGGARASAVTPAYKTSPSLTPYVDALPIAPRVAASGTLVMAEAQHQYHRDLPAVPSWGYGGMSHGGPTLEARSGVAAQMSFSNQLGAHLFANAINPDAYGIEPDDASQPRTSVHLHGGVNRPEHDGHPFATFLPGNSRTYEFSNQLAATALFYHDHAMGLTQLNCYAGLAGHYLLRDAWDTGDASNAWGLPSGAYEIPLIFTECLLQANGQLNVNPSRLLPPDASLPAFAGDVMLVNGKAWPNLAVDRGQYRLRLLNASVETIFGFYFSNGMTFHVIGSDGGLLDAPQAVTRLPIGPGERYDILVDFSALPAGTTVQLLNDMPLPALAGMIGMSAIPNMMQFSVGSAAGHPASLPATLRGGSGQPAALPALTAPQATRSVCLLQINNSQPPLIELSLNNLDFEDSQIETPAQGSVEQWDIINTNGFAHVIHLHLVQYRVLSRQGLRTQLYEWLNPVPTPGMRYAPPADPLLLLPGTNTPAGSWEAGNKDVVICPGYSVTRILVRFPTVDELGFDPDAIFGTAPNGQPLQGYVWHCHMLNHEDHVMMLPYRLVTPGTPAPAYIPRGVRRAVCRKPRR